jgi:3D (Asp-Asp-Asp) domain-containing protein
MTLLLSVTLLAQAWCADMRTTGYVRTEHSPRTFDGTSIYSDEPIAAASWDIPLQSLVEVEDVGTFRVADRGGGLGSSGWIDIAVWSRAEAYQLTGFRRTCVYPPGAQ